jgi:hypothetical protein
VTASVGSPRQECLRVCERLTSRFAVKFNQNKLAAEESNVMEEGMLSFKF